MGEFVCRNIFKLNLSFLLNENACSKSILGVCLNNNVGIQDTNRCEVFDIEYISSHCCHH